MFGIRELFLWIADVMKKEKLKNYLETIYEQFHKPSFMRIDPLLCVHTFSNDNDIEACAFLASSIAYGRAEMIIRNVNLLLEMMEHEPSSFIMNTSLKEKKNRFKGFKHRFNTSDDIALLLECVRAIRLEHGSLETLFTDVPQRETIKENLDHYTFAIKKIARNVSKSVANTFDYLLPSPSSGSACKRLNMFLRWMVRDRDGIDFGLWKNVSPSSLIMPVDTHIARIATTLGFTKRTTADWRMAEEITGALRKFDNNDPVRYDFSLCRTGMVTFRKEAA
jgi:uncharacterized protein (TIGR02757 family)